MLLIASGMSSPPARGVRSIRPGTRPLFGTRPTPRPAYLGRVPKPRAHMLPLRCVVTLMIELVENQDGIDPGRCRGRSRLAFAAADEVIGDVPGLLNHRRQDADRQGLEDRRLSGAIHAEQEVHVGQSAERAVVP